MARTFDSLFHRLIFDAAKNRLLGALYAGINDQLRTPQHRGRLANVATGAEMERDHQRVLDAIRRRDFIDAVHAMVDHVDHDVVIVNEQQEVVPPARTHPRAAAAHRRCSRWPPDCCLDRNGLTASVREA